MFRTTLRLGVAALAAIALVGCGAGTHEQITTTTRAKPAPPPPTTAPSKVAFTQANKLYTINEDGSGKVAAATGSSGAIYWPAWSPVVTNGKSMLTAASRHGLWVMNADGSGLRQIVDTGAAYCVSPCWSRDGTEIAYLVNPDSWVYPDGFLHVVKVADGTDTDLGHYATGPTWSRALPDRIAFSYTGGVTEPVGLKVVTRDAATGQWSDPVLVGLPFGWTHTQVQAWSPPDGQGREWLAASHYGEMWAAPVDPATGLPDATQWQKLAITDTTQWQRMSWSWDATRLCYRGDKTATVRVFTIGTGTDTVLVAPGKSGYDPSEPDWSPKLTP